MRCKTNALLEVNHSVRQRAYVDWKYRNLATLVSMPPKERPSNGGRVAYRFVTRALPVLTPFYRLFYGSGAKSIPDGLELSPLTLAVWLMDDGSRSRRAVYLNPAIRPGQQGETAGSTSKSVGDPRIPPQGQGVPADLGIGRECGQVGQPRRSAHPSGVQIQTPASDPVTTEAFGPRWRSSFAKRGNLWPLQDADPSPLVRQGGGIVCATGNGG